MRTLAERLVWARTQKKLSQDQLATKSGVSQSTIGNLESGFRRSARRIANIANVLDVDVLWLAEGSGTAPTKLQSSDDSHVSKEPLCDDLPPMGFPEDEGLVVAMRLLALFHGTDTDGRAKILRVAERVPQIEKSRVISNKK